MQPFERRAYRWIEELPEGTVFTADTLREQVGSSTMMGRLFVFADAAGLIEKTGRAQTSVRAHRRGGLVREWVRTSG